MTHLLQVLMWVNITLVVYVYIGYPVLLWLLNTIKRKQKAVLLSNDNLEPTVSMVIAAYNEENVIAEKLENSLKLNYPSNKLDIIVVSDGSTDKTPEIVSHYCRQGVRLVE